MQSKFYQPDEQRAEKVRELFTTIARRYDLLNDIMSAGQHRRWKRRLVELAGVGRVPSRGESARPSARAASGDAAYKLRVLDLCCGTGDIALLFARNGSRVTGVDFTDEMLRVAESRCSRACQARPQWIRTDALRLPFPDNCFDVVSVGYGLRNLADLEAGLKEILRVLRPGSRLLSLDFGKPESDVFRALYFGYLRTVLPLLGWMFCGDPDTHGYILASLKNYPAQRGTRELMEECGFADCGFGEFCGGAMAINFGAKPC